MGLVTSNPAGAPNAVSQAAERTLLSPADVPLLGINRTMSFLYRRAPDTALLRENLRLLCTIVPDIAGRIAKSDDGEYCIL
ncbi:MAG: hypothetical protein ACREUG_00815, partial [Steroidobacteraceae bacterium]